MDVGAKRRREQQSLACMVGLYCKGKRHAAPKGERCEACAGLLAYANERTARCPHMATKTFCSRCATPCYQPDMREKVRQVMRYAGPRMLLHHPVLALRHALVQMNTPRHKAAGHSGRETT